MTGARTTARVVDIYADERWPDFSYRVLDHESLSTGVVASVDEETLGRWRLAGEAYEQAQREMRELSGYDCDEGRQ